MRASRLTTTNFATYSKRGLYTFDKHFQCCFTCGGIVAPWRSETHRTSESPGASFIDGRPSLGNTSLVSASLERTLLASVRDDPGYRISRPPALGRYGRSKDKDARCVQSARGKKMEGTRLCSNASISHRSSRSITARRALLPQSARDSSARCSPSRCCC